MRLEAIDVSVSFGKKSILRNIRFSLDHHRFIGIIGPNGSGKSTLLKTFYKLIKPRCGYLTVDGEDLRGLSHKRCSKLMAVLPQQQTTEIELLVTEVVHMGRYPHQRFFENTRGEDWSAVGKTLDDLGLNGLAGRKLPTLSGGERQLVLIARAIVQETPCILLDEPTNHLDIFHQVAILETITRLNKQVVVVFHDLSLAGKYCDYLYLMNKGEIYKQGAPDCVLTRSSIKDVYGLEVDIIQHPQKGHPVVVL